MMAVSLYQDSIVRPNLPDRTESPDLLGSAAEGLVGNRHDDGPDRRSGVDLRRLFSDRRPALQRPAQGR